jgi:hypothetical protein
MFRKRSRSPQSKAVVEHPQNPVYVSANTDDMLGLTPEVVLQIGRTRRGRVRDWRNAQLTPKEARTIAMSLLSAAEAVDDVKNRPTKDSSR